MGCLFQRLGESLRLGVHTALRCDRGFAFGECAPTRLRKYSVGAHSREAGSREIKNVTSYRNYFIGCLFQRLGESLRLGIHTAFRCDRGFAFGECAPTGLWKYAVGAHSREAGSRDKRG